MKRLLLAMLILLSVPRSSLPADVRAFVDRTSLSPEESVRLTVTCEGNDATVDIAPIKEFKVMSRGTSSSVQIINGKVSREVSYNYMLFPLKEGRLTIPPLTVIAEGQSQKTQPIAVTVSKKSRGDEITDIVFVEATVSDETPFEGQQVIYTFKLFRQIQIANAKFQKPAFTGFTAKEIGDQTSYSAIVSGRQYNVTAVSFVLIPINAGEKTIEPATVECDILKPRQGRRTSPFDSFFDDPFFGRNTAEPRILRSRPLTLQVKPLPPYSGSVPFSGLVGEFDISAQLDNPSLSVGDSTTLSVKIKGKGNIMDAEEPVMTVPDGFKTYKDNPQENIQWDTTGASGEKIFRIALVPIEQGSYRLPPIQLNYFDISGGRYRIRSTAAITVSVMPSKDKETVKTFSSPETILPSIKKKVEFTGRDILPLNESLDALESQKPLPFMAFILLILAPMILYLGSKGIGWLMGKDTHPAVQMAQRSEKALKIARKTCKSDSSDSQNEFLTCLYRALVSCILSRAGITGESLTYHEAQELLRSRGYSVEVGEKASVLLERIESAKFGGFSGKTIEKKALFHETETFIRRLLKK